MEAGEKYIAKQDYALKFPYSIEKVYTKGKVYEVQDYDDGTKAIVTDSGYLKFGIEEKYLKRLKT